MSSLYLIDKQTFLDNVQEQLVATERLVTETFGTADKCIVSAMTARQNAEAMRRLYLQSTDIGLAPCSIKLCNTTNGTRRSEPSLMSNG